MYIYGAIFILRIKKVRKPKSLNGSNLQVALPQPLAIVHRYKVAET